MTLLTCLLFWCWLQELVCSCADIVPTDDVQTLCATLDDQNADQSDATKRMHSELPEQCETIENTISEPIEIIPPNPVAMYRTIAALLDVADMQARFAGSTKYPHATNTTTGTNCEGTIDEIDSYHQYFKQIGIHFQKPSALLMENQPDHSTAECQPSETHGDHLNEYCFIDDFDCSASKQANVICGADPLAMQSSLCSSASTNQQQQQQIAHNFYIEQTFETSNDCSININIVRDSVSNNNNNLAPKIDERAVPVQVRRKTPNTLSLNLNLSNTTRLSASKKHESKSHTDVVVTTKKRRISNLKRSYKQMNNSKYAERFALNEITEECEYDSDIGKFNCKVGSDAMLSDNSSGSYEFSDETATIQSNSDSSNDEQNLNDLNLTPKQRNQPDEWFNINKSEKIVMKRIEFFENINGKDEKEAVTEEEPQLQSKPKRDDNEEDLVEQIILSSFALIFIWMCLFPWPN